MGFPKVFRDLRHTAPKSTPGVRAVTQDARESSGRCVEGSTGKALQEARSDDLPAGSKRESPEGCTSGL